MKKKIKRLKNIALMILTIAAMTALILSCDMRVPQSQQLIQEPEEIFVQNQDQEPTQWSLQEINTRISSLVEQVTPSVVSIQVEVVLEDVFGQEEIQQGIGSGVIINEDGYILTNSHVIGNAEKLTVVLYDGNIVEARLIGSNQDTDVGVIKIEADNLKPAVFGSIEGQNVGDIVIAIGSPFGIQQTVTMGIISGKGRVIPVATDLLPIIDAVQTDAAINPGNSGGPLVNIYGQVIGINTIGVSPSGASAGIGFAIPIDTALNIAEQIIEFGRAVIPFIGIEMGLNSTDIPGVLIENIADDSPADKAGLMRGDIIAEFDGLQVITPYEFLSQLLRRNCGEDVSVRIYRNGQYSDLTVFLEECPITN